MVTSVVEGMRTSYHQLVFDLKTFVMTCVRVVGYILRDITWLVEGFGLVLLWTVPMALLVAATAYFALQALLIWVLGLVMFGINQPP